MTLSHWQKKLPSLTRDSKTGVVVIGGGFVGLSCAYWLSELSPETKVTVLERQGCGSGASGKNAGFLTKGSSFFYQSLATKWGSRAAEDIHRYAATSLQLLHQEILSKSPEIRAQRVPSFTLLRREEQKRVPAGTSFREATSAELPVLSPAFLGALASDDEFMVNPLELLGSLKSILLSRNVQIIEDTAAFEIGEGEVRTQVNTISCDQVIIALNAYTPELLPGLREMIFPRRAQMLSVELQNEFPCPGLFYDPTERVYFRRSQEKVLLIGGKRLLDEKGETGNFEKVSPVIQAALESYLRDELGLSFKVIHRWSGIMGFTADELPLLGSWEAKTKAILVAGFSGHGMGFGFHAAREAAELSLGLKKESFFEGIRKAGSPV